jgi:hypothetical protein
VGVGVTHASFGAEVQSELSQVVRMTDLSRWRRARSRRNPRASSRATSSRRSVGEIGIERKQFGMAGDRKRRFETVHLPAKVASDQNKSRRNKRLAK